MKKKTALIAAGAAALGTTFFIFSIGTAMFYEAMVKDRKGDRNYDEERETRNPPSEKATEYRKRAFEYNKWWSEQPTETRHVMSRDGLALEAKLLKADRDTDRLVIVCHGHRCCSGEEGFISKMFHEAGYHVLAIEQRAHGISEGTFIGMGVPESGDVARWAELMSEEFPDCSIVLYGASMGGATVIMANALELPPQVKCVIEDCGFSSISEELLFKMRRDYRWMPFKKLVVGSTGIICRVLEGFSFGEETMKKAAANARLPMMIIHGQDDIVVPAWMGEEIYENCTTEKDILRVPGAGHNVSFFHANEEYKNRIFSFIESHI